jgi:hypothetical protein
MRAREASDGVYTPLPCRMHGHCRPRLLTRAALGKPGSGYPDRMMSAPLASSYLLRSSFFEQSFDGGSKWWSGVHQPH